MKPIPALLALLAVTMGLAAAGRTEPPASERDVPVDHWAYDAINQLQQLGIDPGIPSRTESGHPAYSRQQFAEFTANAVGHADVIAGAGWRHPPQLARKAGNPLARLCAEFAPELQPLGLHSEPFQASLARFERLWRTGRPQGVCVPLVRRAGRHDTASRAAGRERAADEWARGEVVLYVEKRPPDLSIDLSNAISYVVVAPKPDDPAHQEKIAGHNAEVWRRLRQHPPDVGSRLGWTSALFDLEAAWRAAGVRAQQLDAKHPGVVVPDSSTARLVWDLVPASPWERRRRDLKALPDGRLVAVENTRIVRRVLVLDDFPRGEVAMDVPAHLPPSGCMEVKWGPRGSGMFLLRVPVADRQLPYRLYALDLRTGSVLNASAARAGGEGASRRR